MIRERLMDPVPELRPHLRQCVDREPGHVLRLVVGDVCLTVDVRAEEAVVEILRLVAVHVYDGWADADPRQPLDLDVDAGLLAHLADRRDRRLLTGLDDAGDRCPVAVVGSSYQQDLVVASHDGGHPRQPQWRMSDVTAELGYEVGNRHGCDASKTGQAVTAAT